MPIEKGCTHCGSDQHNTTDCPMMVSKGWSPERPSAPGAYYVKGFRVGEAGYRPALVEVARDDDGELVCNIHLSNSNDDLCQWSLLADCSERFEWLGPLAASPAPEVQQAGRLLGGEDHVSIPRGLIGAACSAIDKKRDAPNILAELRRYTYGDLSRQAERQESAKLHVPEECPHMIFFDDADRQPLMFAGTGARQGALRAWGQVSIGWNAHLFVRVARNSRDDRYPSATVAAPQPAAQQVDVRLIDRYRIELLPEYGAGYTAKAYGEEAEPTAQADGFTAAEAIAAVVEAVRAQQGEGERT